MGDQAENCLETETLGGYNSVTGGHRIKDLMFSCKMHGIADLIKNDPN